MHFSDRGTYAAVLYSTFAVTLELPNHTGHVDAGLLLQCAVMMMKLLARVDDWMDGSLAVCRLSEFRTQVPELRRTGSTAANREASDKFIQTPNKPEHARVTTVYTTPYDGISQNKRLLMVALTE